VLAWPRGRKGKGRRREEEEKGKRKRGKEKEKGKRKGRKRRKRKKKGEENEEERRNKERDFGKIRKIVRENWEGFCGVFPGFSGVGAFSGTAVMARWAGRRDRGVRGIPGRWPTAALGRRAWGLAEVRCRRDSRHARRGEREGENRG
jgi:hypothetical protein